METKVLGNRARRKQVAMRKVLRGDIVECCCGMFDGRLRKVTCEMTSRGWVDAGRKV
jgi:hypothetical protein